MSQHLWSNNGCMPAPYRGMAQNFLVGFVSGAVVSSIKNAANDHLDSNEKLFDGFKTALQSGIAAGTIAHANEQMMHGHYGSAMLSLGVGAAGVYGIQKYANYSMFQSKNTTQTEGTLS